MEVEVVAKGDREKASRRDDENSTPCIGASRDRAA